MKLALYSLIASTIFWGTVLGGFAYSHLVFFPVYLSELPRSAVVVNGPYGLTDGRFWALVHPFLILSLMVTLIANRKSLPRRNLVLVSCAIYFVGLVVTMLYFFPELMAFQASADSSVSPAEWLVRGTMWQRLSWIRGGMMYVGFLPLVLALTKTDPVEGP